MRSTRPSPIGVLEKDQSAFDRAAIAYTACLEFRTREDTLIDWAATRWNQSDLALARHLVFPDPELLAQARAHVLAAREVFVEGSEYHTKRCDDLLAEIDAAQSGA
jgi:hypothetical protein